MAQEYVWMYIRVRDGMCTFTQVQILFTWNYFVEYTQNLLGVKQNFKCIYVHVNESRKCLFLAFSMINDLITSFMTNFSFLICVFISVWNSTNDDIDLWKRSKLIYWYSYSVGNFVRITMLF